MFLGLLDPDPDPLVSLKKDVNVASKSNKQKDLEKE
jgi:hypothetical protein